MPHAGWQRYLIFSRYEPLETRPPPSQPGTRRWPSAFLAFDTNGVGDLDAAGAAAIADLAKVFYGGRAHLGLVVRQDCRVGRPSFGRLYSLYILHSTDLCFLRTLVKMSRDDLPASGDLPGPSVEVAVPDLWRYLEHLERPASLERGPNLDSSNKDGRELQEEWEEIVEAASERMEELLEVWTLLRFCQADEVELRLVENGMGSYFQQPIVDGEPVAVLEQAYRVHLHSMVEELVTSDEFQTAHPIELVVNYLTLEEATRAAAWLSRHAEERGDDALDHAVRIVTETMAPKVSRGDEVLHWMNVILGEDNAEGEELVDAVSYLWQRGFLEALVGKLFTHENDRVRERAMLCIAPLLDDKAPEPSDTPQSSTSPHR